MSETQTEAEATVEPVEVDPITAIHKGECPSLSGSTLEFSIGRHSEDGSLWLSITRSSRNGMVCRDWVPATKINEITIGELTLIGRSFQVAQPGRSLNFGSFAKAICLELKLIHTNELNARHASHVPGMTFEKAVMAYFTPQEAPKTAGKSKKLKQV